MGTADQVEEGYPLAPVHSGGEDVIYDGPILPGAGPSRRHGHASTFTLILRSKFYSVRPLVRIIVICVIGLVPFYYMAVGFHERMLRPRPPPGSPEFDERPPPHPVIVDPSPEQYNKTTPLEWSARAQEVRDAFAHAYSSYEKFAFPADELKPITKGKMNPYVVRTLPPDPSLILCFVSFNGWGVTTVSVYLCESPLFWLSESALPTLIDPNLPTFGRRPALGGQSRHYAHDGIY